MVLTPNLGHGELSWAGLGRHHPSLKVSQVKELPKGDLLIIGDSMQDMLILRGRAGVGAALGEGVGVSLLGACQVDEGQNRCLVVRGVPAGVSEADFLDFLNLNKISYAKAEHLKSKKDGRVLPIFKLEIGDPAGAGALVSQNVMCNVTGIVCQVEEFRGPISVTQCFNCQSFGHSAGGCGSKQKCLICGESHSHKGCPNREAKKAKCANCLGPHVASYRGWPEYKKPAFRQHVVSNQKSYAAAVSQNPLPQTQTSQTFQFTAEQLTKFVATVVIQVAQPQVCYPNQGRTCLI